MGEAEFLSTFYTLCSAPWDMPSTLYDLKIDFMKISEWEFFSGMMRNMDHKYTSLIFGDLNFKELQEYPYQDEDGTMRMAFIRPSDNLLITEEKYHAFIPYIRQMINFNHKGKKAGNIATKKILIMEDRKEREKNKNKPYESMLFDAIISLVNTEEFKYDFKTVFDLTIFQLMKSFVQIQGKKAADHLNQMAASGFMDTSKIPKEDFGWIYSEDKYKPRQRNLVNESSKPASHKGRRKK